MFNVHCQHHSNVSSCLSICIDRHECVCVCVSLSIFASLFTAISVARVFHRKKFIYIYIYIFIFGRARERASE